MKWKGSWMISGSGLVLSLIGCEGFLTDEASVVDKFVRALHSCINTTQSIVLVRVLGAVADSLATHPRTKLR